MPVFAVTTAKNVNWDRTRGNREQPFWDEHAAFAEVTEQCAPPDLRGSICSRLLLL